MREYRIYVGVLASPHAYLGTFGRTCNRPPLVAHASLRPLASGARIFQVIFNLQAAMQTANCSEAATNCMPTSLSLQYSPQDKPLMSGLRLPL